MSKLPRVSAQVAMRAFAKAGFELTRSSGSHHHMTKLGHGMILTIPVHAGRDLKPGTLRTLIRKAGLNVDQFVELVNQ